MVAVVYPIGDYLGWWDKAARRDLATSGVNRLASPEGYPKIILFSDEPEFRPLLNLILAQSQNPTVGNFRRRGQLPSAIVRFGETLRVPVGNDAPDMWPNPNFAADASPVMVMYDFSRKGSTGTNSIMLAAGTLGEVRAWISDWRERERFLISSLLIGSLSLLLVVLDISRQEHKDKLER